MEAVASRIFFTDGSHSSETPTCLWLLRSRPAPILPKIKLALLDPSVQVDQDTCHAGYSKGLGMGLLRGASQGAGLFLEHEKVE